MFYLPYQTKFCVARPYKSKCKHNMMYYIPSKKKIFSMIFIVGVINTINSYFVIAKIGCHSKIMFTSKVRINTPQCPVKISKRCSCLCYFVNERKSFIHYSFLWYYFEIILIAMLRILI